MKKLFFATIGFLFFCFGIMLFINFSTPNTEASESFVPETSEKTENSGYIVKKFGENVGIFLEEPENSNTDNKRPIRILNTFVKDLPIEDQKLLFDGVHVKTEEDLAQIIEDYSS